MPKFDRVKPRTKSVVLKLEIKVCALWLPRNFRYRIKAKRVKFTGTGSDRSFTGRLTCVLSVLLCFKESKEKKTKIEKRRV